MPPDSEEIFDRIVEEHHRGGHAHGPVAGCAVCAQSAAAVAAQPPTSPEDLARLRIVETPVPTADPEDQASPLDGAAAARVADELSGLRAIVQRQIAEAGDEPLLGDLALQLGEQALSDTQFIPAPVAAQVVALVGIVRAASAIDETLRRILDVLAGSGVEPPVPNVADMEIDGLTIHQWRDGLDFARMNGWIEPEHIDPVDVVRAATEGEIDANSDDDTSAA